MGNKNDIMKIKLDKTHHNFCNTTKKSFFG